MKKQLIQGLLTGMAISGIVFAADTTGPGIEVRGAGADDGATVAPSGSGNTATSTDRDNSGVTISGKIDTIDRTGNRIWVRDTSGQIRQYKVNDGTSFTSNGREVKFSDIKPGD